MTIAIWLGIFVLCLASLIKASDWFIDAAEELGKSMGIPSFVIGITIVAIGTSLPELAASIAAVLSDESEIVVGNAVGSNITNIALVLGIVSLMASFAFDLKALRGEIAFVVMSAVLLYVLALDGSYGRTDSIILIVGLIGFLFVTLSGNHDDEKVTKSKIDTKTILILLGAGAVIYFGATYLVKAIIKLSDLLNIGSEIIALSLVALGTSLPEVLVSVAAARKGKPEMALGNIMGSNVFNAFAVIGFPGLLVNLTVPGSILNFSLPLLIMVSFMFLAYIFYKRATKAMGIVFLLVYLMFLGGLVYFT